MKGTNKMKITPEQYNQMAKKASPNSKSYINIPLAFLIGGSVCLIGQVIMNTFKDYGFEKTIASIWTSVILILISAILTGMGIYEKIARHAGAGTLVPITGFANAVASPAIEGKSEGYIKGVATQMFVIAGPVIVYGSASSVIYGIIYYIYTSQFLTFCCI